LRQAYQAPDDLEAAYHHGQPESDLNDLRAIVKMVCTWRIDAGGKAGAVKASKEGPASMAAAMAILQIFIRSRRCE